MNQIALIAAALAQLPDRLETGRAIVAQLEPQIRETISRGYRFDDVAKVLVEHGVNLSPYTVRSYITAAPKGRVSRRRRAAAETAKTERPIVSAKATRMKTPITKGQILEEHEI